MNIDICVLSLLFYLFLICIMIGCLPKERAEMVMGFNKSIFKILPLTAIAKALTLAIKTARAAQKIKE